MLQKLYKLSQDYKILVTVKYYENDDARKTVKKREVFNFTNPLTWVFMLVMTPVTFGSYILASVLELTGIYIKDLSEAYFIQHDRNKYTVIDNGRNNKFIRKN